MAHNDSRHFLALFTNSMIVATKEEYEAQIGKWERKVNDVTAALRIAAENHKAKLEAAAAAEQYQFELVLMALSLLTAGTMRFLGAAIQYKLGAKWFSTQVTKAVELRWADRAAVVNMTSDSFNQIMADAVGAVSQDLVMTAADRAYKAERDKLGFDEVLPSGLTTSDVHVLEAALNNTISKAKAHVSSKILAVGMRALLNDEFGAKTLHEAGGDKEKAKQIIVTKLYQVRLRWAKDWFYYGNDPVIKSINQMADAFEREIWALWILNRDETVTRELKTGYGYVKTTEPVPISEVVVARLKDLNVIGAETLRGIAQQTLRVKQQQAPKPTVFGIRGDIDVPKEWEAIERWAKNYPIDTVAGVRLGGIPRLILPFETMFDVLAAEAGE